MYKNIPENTSKNTHNVVAELLFENKEIKKVLDIPSGAGAFTKRLLDHNIEVHSGDIENIMQVENKHFHVADMNLTLPFDNDFFDAAVCIDGIEHLENPFFFVRECNRIVKKGGYIIISTPNISALRSRWRWLLTGHHNKGKSPLTEQHQTYLHHINLLSFHRLRYILHTNGFKITSIRTNRVKWMSYTYFPLIPFAYLKTWLVYGREKDKVQKQLNKEILSQMFSFPIVFGETMILKAEKV